MNTTAFRNMHNQSRPLLIANVWDVASANAAEKLGFQAIGTSSAAVAAMLGYEDGEQMTFEELYFIVNRIRSSCKLPLSVDIENGYSEDPLVTAEYIKRLAAIGVVGINIEDSSIGECRSLMDAHTFAGFLSAVKCQINKDNTDIFINVRTDTFLLTDKDQAIETCERAGLYKAAGADGLFVPGVTKPEDIQLIARSSKLPLNVMCMPGLPEFEYLNRLGVRRISMGNFVFDCQQAKLENTLKQIQSNGSFASVF